MFHPGTQKLIDHWSALPDAGRIPSHVVLQPLALGGLVPQLFSADRTPSGAALRLAGAGLETLFGQTLRGQDWLSVWTSNSRGLVTAAVAQTFREARPVVIVAETSGSRRTFEIVIAPLRSAGGSADRIVGLYQPTTAETARTEPVRAFSARLSIGVGPTRRAPLTLAAMDGRRIA
ncbi:PAS domain-containing protein [Brevundimonas sp. R86498]|uniref:PAS domain-containing protein n=1 Tax=Brevundimonas sp. R86498 TaxID=3093845 RepID=UPI0037CB1C98